LSPSVTFCQVGVSHIRVTESLTSVIFMLTRDSHIYSDWRRSLVTCDECATKSKSKSVSICNTTGSERTKQNMLSDKYSFTVFTTLWRVPVVNILFNCLSNCHDLVTVIPLSPSINECRTHHVANFGVQQQTCGVNGFQPLQVLESMAWWLEILM
jgi:hypothetical protein